MKMSKKYVLILAGLGVLAIFVQINFILQPGVGYGMREQRKYQAEQRYKMMDSTKLLTIVHKQFYPDKTIHGYFNKFFKPQDSSEMAIKVLASRTNDSVAVQGLTDIILNKKSEPEGYKWSSIYYSGKYKNRAMLPALCGALKKHTLYHTDELIVEALVNIDDTSALNCLIQEKDKLAYKKSRALSEKAIEKWSKEK